MARIPITTRDTITRLGDSCIDDLLELYTPKDLTKEKENLIFYCMIQMFQGTVLN